MTGLWQVSRCTHAVCGDVQQLSLVVIPERQGSASHSHDPRIISSLIHAPARNNTSQKKEKVFFLQASIFENSFQSKFRCAWRHILAGDVGLSCDIRDGTWLGQGLLLRAAAGDVHFYCKYSFSARGGTLRRFLLLWTCVCAGIDVSSRV